MARFVAALRARGVSVLFPYLAWDTGTRREGVRDEEAVMALLRRAGTQGINGDSIPTNPPPSRSPRAPPRWPSPASTPWNLALSLSRPCFDLLVETRVALLAVLGTMQSGPLLLLLR